MNEYILTEISDIKYVTQFHYTPTTIYSFYDLLSEKTFYVKISPRGNFFKEYIHGGDVMKKLFISIRENSVYLDKKIYNNARVINGKKILEYKNNYPEYFI